MHASTSHVRWRLIESGYKAKVAGRARKSITSSLCNHVCVARLVPTAPRCGRCTCSSLQCQFSSTAEYVEAGCERSQRRRRVHVCNWAGISLCVPGSLHRAIALAIRVMRRAVLTPVVWMTDPPSRLRSSLVVAIVGVASQMLPLPASPPFALACGSRAIPLIGDLQKWMESTAAGEAKAGRFHDRAPWILNHVARSGGRRRVVKLTAHGSLSTDYAGPKQHRHLF